jgi:hypothetical protein
MNLTSSPPTSLSFSPPQEPRAKEPSLSLRDWRTRIIGLAGLYGGVCIFFAAVWLSGSKTSPLNLATAAVYLTIRLLGTAIGFTKLRRARFDISLPAHWMLLAFCLALLLDAIGAVIWLTYNLRGVLVPYPSLADIGYGGDTILWAVGLVLFLAVLDTTPQEALGEWISLLTAVWSLTIVLISLIHGSSWTTVVLPQVALDILYPFVWALNCALAGALLFGPQHKRLQQRWRWFVVLVYAGSLVTFLTNIAYALTAASPAGSAAAKYLYFNGGPLDFLFATGDYLLVLAIVVLPLGRPVFRTEGDEAGQHGESPTVQAIPSPAGAAEQSGSLIGHRPAESAAALVMPVAEPVPSAPSGENPSRELVETLRDEVQFLRHELELRSGEGRTSPADCASGPAGPEAIAYPYSLTERYCHPGLPRTRCGYAVRQIFR